MANIQHHFKLIVTQTIFLADMIEITICLSVLFVLIMYWTNSQISNNNETIIELMKANITLISMDLQQAVSSIGMLFNMTKIVLTNQIITQQNTSLTTLLGTFTNQEKSIIRVLEELTAIQIPDIDYYMIQLSSQSIAAKESKFSVSNFTGPFCTSSSDSNLCSYLKQFTGESFDYFAFMKAQRASSVLFYTLIPFDLQKTQICGEIITGQLYQCFVLNYATYQQPNGILYGILFTINNSAIFDITDNCLQNDFKCSVATALADLQLNTQNNDDVVTFLKDISNAGWTNQMLSVAQSFDAASPISNLQVVDIKVYFYQPIQIGISNIDDDFSSEYKYDLLDQEAEEKARLENLQKTFNRWQLLGTFNNELYDELIYNKEEKYFYFFLYFQFFVLIVLCTPVLVNLLTQKEFDEISLTLNQVSLMMQLFYETDYDTIHQDLIEFKSMQNSKLSELNELLQVFDEFCWLIDFLNQLNKKVQDLSKLEKGLVIFEKRNSIECLELILMKLISENSRQKKYEDAIAFNNQLKSLLEKQKNDTQIIKQEEIMRINYKLFQALNQQLDLLSKLLIRNKGKDRSAWNQAKQLFSNIMDFADTLEIRFTLQIKLLFKKCKLLFNLRKIKEAEQCIDQAQAILQQNYTLSKNASYQNKTLDKKLNQIIQQKIYFYRGLIYMSSGQLQPAAQQLMLALDYGNVFQLKFRVKTIKMLSKLLAKHKEKKFDAESKIIKQIKYFYQNKKRVFTFLIDSTLRMADNQLEIVETIKQVCIIMIQIFSIMNDDDQIKVSNFDEQVHVIIETQSKISLLENMGKNYMDDGFFDSLSGRQTQNQRKLYSAILQKFEEKPPQKYTQYLIVMTFGENHAEENDLLQEVLEKLREEYCHFILCSTQEKKYMNQRNTFYRLAEEARDGTYIELFANFEEGLSKLVSLCN